jgi:hypothetical protein
MNKICLNRDMNKECMYVCSVIMNMINDGYFYWVREGDFWI